MSCNIMVFLDATRLYRVPTLYYPNRLRLDEIDFEPRGRNSLFGKFASRPLQIRL